MMQNIPKLKIPADTQQAAWLSGVIIEQETPVFSVRVDSEARVYRAEKALSCLLEPRPGDLVVLFVNEQGTAYVMSILERDASKDSGVLEGEVHFPGAFSLDADQGLSLHTKNLLKVEADHLQGVIRQIDWFSKLINLTNRELSITTGLARRTCKVRELFSGSITVSADQSVRNIRKTEMVRSEVYDLKTRALTTMESPCLLMKGKELVKMDSSQVHIG